MGEVIHKMPEGVQLTPLKIIPGDTGNIFHALKATEASFVSFGEAYFSTVQQDKRKGWKKHTRMTLNIVVPVGEIGFVLYDDRASTVVVFEVILSRENYQRLTVPPGIWMAFYGRGPSENILLNIASIPHDPAEAENLPIGNDYIKYNWR